MTIENVTLLWCEIVVRWPPFVNLNKPDELGLNYTHVFRLNTTPDISVGAWHVLPDDLSSKSTISTKLYPDLLKAGNPIILYLHGNTGTRAGWYRVQLYKVLTKAGFHVVTFDYRGYGDSDGEPSEEGLVQDSVAVFNWIKQRSADVPVYIWGHSLGSAVATHTAKVLCKNGAKFDGLILESAFNNFAEAASNHPFSMPFRIMPWFDWVFIDSIKKYNIRFASDENIAGVTVDTLILHATDDGVVPYSLGRKLYDAALQTKHKGTVKFVTFDGEHNYGHKHIHKAPELTNIVREFTTSTER